MKREEGNRFLHFCLGKEEYAIPLLVVREVIALPDMTPVPFMPSYFVGIMNLRGQVISVLDLRKKMGIPPVDRGETSVIICTLQNLIFGVIVDAVSSVLDLMPDEIAPPPDLRTGGKAGCISGVYKMSSGLVLLLEIGNVLDLEDYRAVDRSAAGQVA